MILPKYYYNGLDISFLKCYYYVTDQSFGKRRNMQKDVILDATERLILENGANETSISDIAKEVGISKSSLYYYFESKEELIEAVTERYIDNTQRAIDVLVERFSARIKIEAIAKGITKHVREKKGTAKLHYLLITYGITQDEKVAVMIRERYRKWYKQIIDTLDGYKKTRYNEALAQLILTFIDGYTLRNVLGIDIDTDLDGLIKLFKKVCPLE